MQIDILRLFLRESLAFEQDQLVLPESCMTYTTAECTVNKLLMMDRRTVRNMQIFMQK